MVAILVARRAAVIGFRMPCLSPIDIKRPSWALVRRYISVPCGRCVGCKLERARQWTIRIMHEAQGYRDNSFLTLTMRDEELVYGGQQATLFKPHLQNFWKRLRKEVGHVRYFACGEYGELRSRPHYHACLFGFDFPDKRLLRAEEGRDLFSSELLDSLWTHGHCSVGALTPGSAAYVARYILDKNLGKEAVYYEAQGIEPEFTVMSRRPGIGSKWFGKYAGDVYPEDRVVGDNGAKSRPPRFYDKLFEAESPEVLREIKIKRLINAEKRWDPVEQGAKRMMNKIRFHQAKVKSFSKKLHT